MHNSLLLCTKKLLPQRRGLCILTFSTTTYIEQTLDRICRLSRHLGHREATPAKGALTTRGHHGSQCLFDPQSQGGFTAAGIQPRILDCTRGQVPLDFSWRLAMSPTTLTFFKSVGQLWDFPGGQVVKTLGFQCRGRGFDPWLGNQDLICHTVLPPQKSVGHLFCTMSLPLALSNIYC